MVLKLLSLSVLLKDFRDAGQLAMSIYKREFDVSYKEDKSPVTEADLAVDKVIVGALEKTYPNIPVVSEERSLDHMNEDNVSRFFLVDPIDGTKSFIIGRPTFGTLIALCENGVPILGIIDQPILGERGTGVKGQPTLFRSGVQARYAAVTTRPCAQLSQAKLASTSPSWLVGKWEELRDKSDFLVWGGDCYSYGLITLGQLDVVVESGLSIYDYAAIPPIVEGAGGYMCDWNGKPLDIHSDGRVLALGDITVKDQLLDILN